MRIEAASHGDVEEIEALLVGCGLPTAGLRDQFPAAYAIAIDLGVIVGCAGLETYGDVGLLRSVAVSGHHQSRGIGRALVANRVDAATAWTRAQCAPTWPTCPRTRCCRPSSILRGRAR